MPVSKEELAKALKILKELLVEAEEKYDIDSKLLEPLEAVSDVIGSDLFSRLVDIQNIQGKSDFSHNGDWQGGVALNSSDNSELLISNEEIDITQPPVDSLMENSNTDSNELLEEELSPAHILPIINSTPPVKRHEQATLMMSTSTGNTSATTTRSLENSNTNDLSSIMVHSIPSVSRKGKKRVDNGTMKDSPSSIKYIITSSEETDDNNKRVNGGVADLLSPMRDMKSLADIKQAARGRHGKDPRCVTLVQSHEGLGIEFVGLRRTGIFISSMSVDGVAEKCSLLQVGDQLLKVNENNCDDLASFEIAHKIEEIAVGEQISLTVVYNPTGLKEYQRLCPR